MTQLPKLHYAGIDWATKTHAVCVVDQAGQIRARFQVPNTGKGLTGLIKRLGSLGVAGVAIERSDGPLVEAMLEADLRVVVVTPRQDLELAQPVSGQRGQVRSRRRLPAG